MDGYPAVVPVDLLTVLTIKDYALPKPRCLLSGSRLP